MNAIRIIGWNTFIELLRNKILFGLVVFALLMMAFSLVLGNLSYAEQARITINFGLSAIQISSVVLSIFVGSTLVSREIEKQTILTLLSRPISRLQFLLGKALGLILINAVIIICLALMLSLSLLALDIALNPTFFLSLFGVLLESSIILGFAIFFSTFSTPFMVVAFSTGIWLIGHWMQSLAYFASAKGQGDLSLFSQVLHYILPDLERFNWRLEAVYADPIRWEQIAAACGYFVGWFGVVMTLSLLVFRRKDFV